MACDHAQPTCTCPFVFTEASEQVQNYGCLPTPHDIVVMRTVHGKTWACHDDPSIPCAGALRHLAKQGLPYKVIDSTLVTEASAWNLYAEDNVVEPLVTTS